MFQLEQLLFNFSHDTWCCVCSAHKIQHTSFRIRWATSSTCLNVSSSSFSSSFSLGDSDAGTSPCSAALVSAPSHQSDWFTAFQRKMQDHQNQGTTAVHLFHVRDLETLHRNVWIPLCTVQMSAYHVQSYHLIVHNDNDLWNNLWNHWKPWIITCTNFVLPVLTWCRMNKENTPSTGWLGDASAAGALSAFKDTSSNASTRPSLSVIVSTGSSGLSQDSDTQTRLHTSNH